MRAPRIVPGLLVALALTTAGCGSDDEGSAPTTGGGSGTEAAAPASTSSSAAPASGTQTVSGTGYSTTVPSAWRDGRKAVEGSAFRIDLIYGASGGSGFGSNLVVTRENPAAVKGRKVEELEAQVRSSAAGAVGAKTPEPEDPTTLDGEDAIRWTLRREQSGTRIAQRQLIAMHDDALYTLTLSSAADDDEGEGLLRTVMDGWRWK